LTHIKTKVGLQHELYELLNGKYKLPCRSRTNDNITPELLAFYHWNGVSHLYCNIYCKDCKERHTVHNKKIERHVVEDMVELCGACNDACVIHEIKKAKSINKDIPHKRELCEMCQRLGYYCRNSTL
jgi:hypothetical protein